MIFIFVTDLSWTEAGFQIGIFNPRLFVGVGIASAIILVQVIQILRLPEERLDKDAMPELMKYIQKNNRFYALFYPLVLVGPIEELLYRGFLQGHLQNMMSGSLLTIGYATLITGLIFGLIHLINVVKKEESLKGNLKQLPGRISMGILLGYIFQASNSLLLPIILHDLLDGASFATAIYKFE